MSTETAVPPAAGGEDARAFLRQFESRHRGYLGCLFHDQARRGATTPAAVLSGVRKEARERFDSPHSSESQRRSLEYLLLALANDPQGAANYAVDVLEWEALPFSERERRKAERDQLHRRAFLAGIPPTERQIAYLHALGHYGPPPANRDEASRLIDALKKGSAQ